MRASTSLWISIASALVGAAIAGCPSDPGPTDAALPDAPYPDAMIFTASEMYGPCVIDPARAATRASRSGALIGTTGRRLRVCARPGAL